MKQTNNDRPFREIVADYLPPADVMNGDDYAHVVRRAVERLDAPDRNLLLMYAEFGSLRKLAERCGVSHPTVLKQIRRIREAVREEIAAALKK